ncbi:MAG: hypothetical protein RL757_3249 [Bacteroidota bacterium]|jgi:SsrA-binding protein
MAKAKKPREIQILNRKAEHEYYFVKEYDAGMVLAGTEVKALRDGMANLTDAYCVFMHGELYVRGLHISEYLMGTYANHESRRIRKLLLRKTELKSLEKRSTERGFTIVPYKIYFNERGLAKLRIALAQGKKTFDKRETLKERDQKRELDAVKKIKLR